DALDQRLLEAELPDLLRPGQAIEIEMPNRPARRLIGLDEGEGRARDLLADAEGADEEAGEARLAGAQHAAEGQHVTGLRPRREGGGERRGGRLVGERERAREYCRHASF